MRDLISKLIAKKTEDQEVGRSSEAESLETTQAAGMEIAPDAEQAAETTDNAEDLAVTEEGVADTVVSDEDDASLIDEMESSAASDVEATIPMELPLEDTVVGLREVIAGEVSERVPMIQVAHRCDIGYSRSRNEDSSYVLSAESGGEEPLISFGLYIVADGMGGHFAGHEASKSVSRLVAKNVLERIYLPMLRNNTADRASQEPIGEVMLDAVRSANRSIHAADPEKESGTTLTAALIFGRRLYIAHVGDSRAYLLTNGELNTVTTDHSYVRRLQDAGQLTEEEAATHPQRNMLYRAVGQGGELEVDTFTQSLPQKGKLMLCSDGLWGLVSDHAMHEVLERDLSLQSMADELVEMALQAGGYDNISVVLVDFRF